MAQFRFIEIVQVVSVLCAIEIFNVLAIHPDDHVGITMPMTLAIKRGFSPQFNALVSKLCRVCSISR